MNGEARDPYERMLSDALDNMARAAEKIHTISLELNTAKGERDAIFRHIESMRKEVDRLHKLSHGDGNGSPGYGDRIRRVEGGMGALEKLETRMGDLETKVGDSYDLAKLRWWAVGTIIAALGSVGAHFVR